MGYLQYIELLLSAPWLYVAALVIAALPYLYVLRRQVDTVFDPLALNMFFAAIGTATVIFLLFTGNVEKDNFIQYCASESCYLFFLTVIPLRLGRVRYQRERGGPSARRLLQSLYLIAAPVFVVSQGVMYLQNGLPILYESRLDYYAGGGGIGMFSRVIQVSSFLCWYLLLHKYAYRWQVRYLPRVFDLLLLGCLVASAVLSGSKSELLVIVFLIFYFRALHRGSPLFSAAADKSLQRIQRVMLCLAVLVALSVLLVTGLATTFVGSLSALLTRIMSAGDTYFMAYPGNNLHDLNGSHPILALFGSTLAMFRLVDPSKLTTPLGFQLFRNVVGSTANLGPNPRHNIFGLVYFGYVGSAVYSSLLGLWVCLVRNVLCKYIRLGGVSELIYVFMALHVIDINVDLQSFTGSMDSLVMVFPLLLGAAYVLDIGSALAVEHVGMSNRVQPEPNA